MPVPAEHSDGEVRTSVELLPVPEVEPEIFDCLAEAHDVQLPTGEVRFEPPSVGEEDRSVRDEQVVVFS